MIIEEMIINQLPDPKITCDFKNVYYPSDDTYLIIDYFKNNISEKSFDGIKIEEIKNILDLGTGTGIIAIFLLYLSEYYNNFNPKIYASDILKEAIDCARINEKLNYFEGQIQFFHSNLFASFPDKLRNLFDVIIFNPPYLPSSNLINNNKNKKNIDYSWNGGNKGFNILLDFLKVAKIYLKKSSRKMSYIYFISSSKTNLNELELKIIKEGFRNIILETKHVFFEDIFLNRIEIS